MANITGGPSISSNNSLDDSQTNCVTNMRDKDIDSLSEELWEDLTLTDDAQAQLKTSLNETLPLARHLQEDVFHWAPPVFHLVLFTISGMMLFVAVTNSSSKRPYKSMVLLAVLFSGFALALAFVATIGSLQALNGLVDGDESKKTQWLGGNIFVYRAGSLYYVQAIQVSLVAIFYTLMGIIFVGRSA